MCFLKSLGKGMRAEGVFYTEEDKALIFSIQKFKIPLSYQRITLREFVLVQNWRD